MSTTSTTTATTGTTTGDRATAVVAAVTFDCRDALAVSAFWSEALGMPVDAGPPAPSPFFASIGRDADAAGPVLMFIQVPEGKTVKNRVHLDLRPADGVDADALVARCLELGATHVHDKDEWGMQWTTLTDPEGNELCIGHH